VYKDGEFHAVLEDGSLELLENAHLDAADALADDWEIKGDDVQNSKSILVDSVRSKRRLRL